MIVRWTDQRSGARMTLARRLGFFVFVACALAIAVPTRAAECPQTSVSDGARTLVAKNAPPWDTLRIWQRQPPTTVEAAQAEFHRIGGSRLVFEIDANHVRMRLLDRLRLEAIRVLRDAGIKWANAPARKGDAIEVRLRQSADVDLFLRLLTPYIARPDQPSLRNPEAANLGEGLVRLTPSEAALGEELPSCNAWPSRS
jgi:hypothetical protein